MLALLLSPVLLAHLPSGILAHLMLRTVVTTANMLLPESASVNLDEVTHAAAQ